MKTWKAIASWPLAPCQGPTGIAYDKAPDRIFSGCTNKSVVVDPNTGKVAATIRNGTRVDARGWDPSAMSQSSTRIRSDKYATVATVDTFPGAKTHHRRRARPSHINSTGPWSTGPDPAALFIAIRP